MNKKTRAVIFIVLLAIFCLGTFVSCSQNKVNIFDYSSDNLGVVGKLVRLMHGWIGNYGWTVVVFTVFLKIIMLPLDFWQRYSSRKSTAKMQRLQPLIEGIDKRYGANTQRANEEKQKLYKKQGYSMFSMCLPMLVSMGIFFVMFAGLRNYSTYSTVTTFRELSTAYYQVYAEEIENSDGEIAIIFKTKYDAVYKENYDKRAAELAEGEEVDVEAVKLIARIAGIKAIPADNENYAQALNDANNAAKKAVENRYLEIRESWLWIQNVWQPDTWEALMPQYDSGANSFTQTVDMSGYPDDSNGRITYDTIRNVVLSTGSRGNEGKWNGLMILPILSIGLSFLSMWISQFIEKKNRKGEVVQNQQQAATNKTMMILMPLMMAYFGFIYTGAFAIYMVVNYTLSIVSTIALRVPVEKLVDKNLSKGEKNNKSSKASYMR